MPLKVPQGEVRPTQDRVREALFNILGPVIEGARVLDLFCGSGSVGLEALSRGAASARMVDASRSSCATRFRRCGFRFWLHRRRISCFRFCRMRFSRR